jgi:hypothetical protein
MFKPMIERVSQARGFGGAVQVVNLGLPSAMIERSAVDVPSPLAAPSSTLLTVLAKIVMANPVSNELQKEKTDLLASTVFDLPAVDAFLEACAEERESILEKRHVELRSACRQQAAIVQKLEANLASAELSLMNIANESDAANQELCALSLIELRGQHVPRWSTDEERQDWAKKKAAVQQRVTQMNQAAAKGMQARNQAYERLQPAIEEMNRLGHEELRVGKELAGETYIDPEFGLTSPPSGGIRQ